MQRIEHPVPYYRFNQFEDVQHGIFTRQGGVSEGHFNSLNVGGTVGDDLGAVKRNHEIMYETLGVDGNRAVTVWQVHGVDTVIANQRVKGRNWLARADAMITNQRGLPLTMRYADCTPIMAYDPVQGVIGVAHAGWRGTVEGMSHNLIYAMTQAYACQPEDIRTGIGPAIGPDRYQVGEEVVEAVIEYYGTTDGLIKRDPEDGTAYLNLWEANRRDLLKAGVKDEHIDVAEICTAENTDEFYSHRAEKGKTGRFGTVICLPEK